MIIRSIAFLFLAAAPAFSDTIRRNDGETIADVSITSETLKEVSYKDGRKTLSMPSAEILSIDYEEMPALVEEGLSHLLGGDAASALSAFQEYVDGNLPKMNERRYKWAPAFAAFQVVLVQQQLGNLEGVVNAADRMIANYADSRLMPEAYLMKASALSIAGQGEKATKTLDTLSALVSSNGLSKRWDLECRLARVRADASRQGETRRSELSGIQREAGTEYPSVARRAKLAEGESYLLEAEKLTDAGKGGRLRENGQRIFEAIIADKQSGDVALAGAHTGLGDCLFFAGADSDDQNVLKQAALNYLRVITLYQAQSEYVAKSLFFAMRCFQLMGDKGRARDMKNDLLRLYADSMWANRQEVARVK